MTWSVDTEEEAAALTLAPLLVREPFERLLDRHGLGKGPVEAALIGDGQSNVTISVRRGPDRFVLRRPPRPPFQPTAHDVLREARIQQALQESAVPVPEIVLVHPEPDVLGVPFYVMRWLDGDVMTTELPARFDRPDDVRSIVETMASTLADLHAVDVAAVGLGDLGRPNGYNARQLRRWHAVWEKTRGRELPDVDAVGTWLAAHAPAEVPVCLVHGDYRVGNLMFAPTSHPELRAVLDWEIATLGDPFVDLAWTLTTYPELGDQDGSLLEVASCLVAPGAPSRAEFARLYEKFSGRDLPDMRWYLAFAFYRAAVGLESLFVRREVSRAGRSPFLDGLEAGIPELAARALAETTRPSF